MNYHKTFRKTFTGLSLMILSNFASMSNAFSQDVIVLPTIEMNTSDDNENSGLQPENQIIPLVLSSQKIQTSNLGEIKLTQKFATALKIVTTPHYSLTLSYNGLVLRNNGRDVNLSETFHFSEITDFVYLNDLIYILSENHLYSFDPIKMDFSKTLTDENISSIFTKDDMVIAVGSDLTFAVNSIDGSVSVFSENKVEQLVSAQNGIVLAIENDGNERQLVSYSELDCSGFDRQVIQSLDPIATVNLAYVEASDNFILTAENSVYVSETENISWNLLIQSDSKIESITMEHGLLHINLINSSIITVHEDGFFTIQAKIETNLPAQILKNKSPKLVMDLDRSQSHKKVFFPLLLGINPEYSHTVFDDKMISYSNDNVQRNQLKWSPIIGTLYDENVSFLLTEIPTAFSLPYHLFPNTNTFGILIAFTEQDLFSNFRVEISESGVLS